MESGLLIKNIVFTSALRATAEFFAINRTSIMLVLTVEACSDVQNSPYVERVAIMSLSSGFSYVTKRDCLYQLVDGGYLFQKGGKASPSASPHRHCWNKAQYALTGEGRLVIRFFNKKYAELMDLPIPVSYKGGFPKGAKRNGKQGKMILPDGFVRSDRALGSAKYREGK